MKRLLSTLGLAFGLCLLSAPVASADPGPTTLTKPCSYGNVDCEGESGDDAEPGNWCSFDHDGKPETPALEGHVDHKGRCVCAQPPTTTVPSTTVPETTTSTVPETTTTTEAPTTSTTVVQPSTTVSPTTVVPTTEEPSTTTAPTLLPAAPSGPNQPPTTTVRFNQARSQGELPLTGMDSTLVTGAVGLSLVALGGALVFAARRRVAHSIK